jgi:hypothetical protein
VGSTIDTESVEGGPPIAGRAPNEEVKVFHVDPSELPSK